MLALCLTIDCRKRFKGKLLSAPSNVAASGSLQRMPYYSKFFGHVHVSLLVHVSPTLPYGKHTLRSSLH